MASCGYMELRLRSSLLLSELCCCRTTVVRGVFVLHALSSSNIFVLLIFQEKHENKKHCSEQDISTNWGIKKEVDSYCSLLLMFALLARCFIFLGFVLRCAALGFILCMKDVRCGLLNFKGNL